MKKAYAIDSEANAVVLFEKISVEIVGKGNGEEYTIHRVIKNLKPLSPGYNIADVKVFFFNSHLLDGKVVNIKGTTYNMEGNELVATPLSKENILTTRANDRHKELVFTMPQVKDGSVIDYEYTVKREGLYYEMPVWEIQEEHPKLISEYDLITPDVLGFNAIWQGLRPFSDFHNEQQAEAQNSEAYHLQIRTVTDNVYHTRWVEKNIPAIKEEPYISCVENYIERQEVQLSGSVAGYRIDAAQIMTTWEKMDELLLEREDFGKELNKSCSFLDQVVDSLSKPGNTAIDSAKNIFDHIRRNFTCTSFDALYFTDKSDLKKVYNNKSGNEAEINLLLVKMLRKAGMEAYPVVLSKRGSIRVTEVYPIIDRLNYVVCMVKTSEGNIYLDATNRCMPFGSLPVYCYNGYARAVGKNGMDLKLSTEDIKEKNIYYYDVTWLDIETMKIEVSELVGVYRAMQLRNMFQKDKNKLSEYVKEIANAMSGEATSYDVSTENLYNPDTSLILKYTIRLKVNAHKGLFYFNPSLHKFFGENPFKSSKRTLPVEFPYQIQDTYIMNMHVPEFYTIEEISKPSQIVFGKNDMKFKFIEAYDSSTSILSVQNSLNVNTTAYSAVNYDKIKGFFGNIIADESKILVFKKTAQTK